MTAVRPVLDSATLRRAVVSATYAPSVYNSQPWRWRTSPSDGIDLFADPTRRLITTDSEGRDLLLSCGAALNHLVVALAGLGWSAEVTRLPDPEDIHHLAHIRPRAASPTAEMAALAAVIPHRRTDRRRFSAVAVEAPLLDSLAAEAAIHDTELHVARGTTRDRLIAIITESAGLQQQQLGYAAEAATWTSRHVGSGDGIQAGNVTVPGLQRPGDIPMRPYPHSSLAQPPHSLDHHDASVLIVLTTASDDPGAVLRAGEATSAVLLAATSHGVASTPLSQPLEISQTRRSISTDIGGLERFPQLLIRLGWPLPDAPALPPVPRRSLDFVLEELKT